MTNIQTGSAVLQGKLWGAEPRTWAETEEPKSKQLFVDVFDALDLKPGAKLLDAGCGSGLAAQLAAERGARVRGIDASAGMVEVAAERVPSGTFVVGDLEQLPYADHEFDVTVAFNSIFYCMDMLAAMSELARVTRPGGRVVMTAWGTPEECEMSGVFRNLMALLPERPKSGGPFALSETGAMEALYAKAGIRPALRGKTLCTFVSPSWDAAWRGMHSAGPVQGAIAVAGLDAVKAAAQRAVEPFARPDGQIVMVNAFAWLVGELAA